MLLMCLAHNMMKVMCGAGAGRFLCWELAKGQSEQGGHVGSLVDAYGSCPGGVSPARPVGDHGVPGGHMIHLFVQCAATAMVLLLLVAEGVLA